MRSVEEMLEDEWYMVRHSGEIPEIALNASFYYLTRDKRGPQLTLTDEQELTLRHAAQERFQEIVLRDLIPENRDKTIYRGLARAIANWQRYVDFCSRQGLVADTFRQEVANQFQVFLHAEWEEKDSCACESGINCSKEELNVFAETLGVADQEFKGRLQMYCLKA